MGNLEVENELQINYVLNDHKFKLRVNNIKSEAKKSNYLIGKYILYYIHIKPESIKFSNHYKEKISDLLKYYNTNEERFKNLDEILHDTGFYVPLQIEIGAKFYTHESESYTKIDRNTDAKSQMDAAFHIVKEKNNVSYQDRNEYGNSLRREGQNIIGGNPHKENFDDWKNSVNR